jgi:hypothetical protein
MQMFSSSTQVTGGLMRKLPMGKTLLSFHSSVIAFRKLGRKANIVEKLFAGWVTIKKVAMSMMS